MKQEMGNSLGSSDVASAPASAAGAVHSPLPWRYEFDERDCYGHLITADKNFQDVCHRIVTGSDAEFIVRACNNFYQLATALEMVADQLERIGDNRKDAEFIEVARAALAKAQQ